MESKFEKLLVEYLYKKDEKKAIDVYGRLMDEGWMFLANLMMKKSLKRKLKIFY